MQIWNEPGSVVAPLIIGYHRPTEKNAFVLDAWAAARAYVPETRLYRRRREGRKAVSRPHVRELVRMANDDGDIGIAVRCIDRWEGETSQEAADRWVWEARCVHLKVGLLEPAVPAGLEPVRVEVMRYRIDKGVVVGAAQLALLRHLFVSTLRTLDPHLVVSGGQHDWDDTWWAGPPAEEEHPTPDIAEQGAAALIQGQWAADPYSRFDYRYYDGHTWTEHVSTDGVASTDPIGADIARGGGA